CRSNTAIVGRRAHRVVSLRRTRPHDASVRRDRRNAHPQPAPRLRRGTSRRGREEPAMRAVLHVRCGGLAHAHVRLQGQGHIDHGNGVRTQFRYEPTTRRLSAIDTTRTDGKLLQALRYTYDAVGNIVQIDDAAQQTVFFDNDAALPRALYEYDALYRLALAEGREHKGQNAAQRDHDDPIALTPPDDRDGSALIRYRETYRYDATGNIAALHHENAGTSWTR